MKQTAVDWLEERLTLSLGDELKPLRGFFVLAKEMEKEMVCGFAYNFMEDRCFASFEGYVECNGTTEEYYDEIFNTKKVV